MDDPDLAPHNHHFLAGGGEMGALMRAHDWARTPLGPIESWPQSLKTATAILLRSPVPMVMLWGEDGVMIYNDAYSVFAGGRHPQLLGSKVREGWPEVADFNDNVMKVGLAGGTLAYKDQELTLYRTGKPEQVWMNLDYSPVLDESGKPAGVLAIVVETTEGVLAERALRESEGRLRFTSGLDEALRESHDAPAAMLAAAEQLARRLDASRCAYADVDADSDRFFIRDDYTAPGVASSAGTYSLDLFGPRAAADMRAGRTLVVRDVAGELAPGEGREMFLSIGIGAIVCCPLVKDGRLVAMMAVHQDAPRDWRAEEIALVERVVERCWAHVERVGAEARLRDSEARLKLVQAAGGIGSFDYDLQKDDAICSPEYYALFGLPDGYPINRETWPAAIHPDDRHKALEALDRAIAERQPFDYEYRIIRADNGEVRWLSGRAAIIFDDQDRPWRYIGGNIDVTERRSAEERLRESEARYRTLFEAIESGFCIVEVNLNAQAGRIDYRVVEANPAFYRQTGFPETILGQWLREAAPALEEHWYEIYGRVARTGESERFEQGSDLLGRWFDVYAFPTGEPEENRVAILFNDISARRDAEEALRELNETLERRVEERAAELEQAQEALRQSQKMEAVGQLTGGVAHDFNNLLQIVTGNLDILQRNLPADAARLRRAAANAMTGAARAATLTQRLLAFSRRQPLEPKPLSINRLVTDMSELLGRTLGETVEVETILSGGLWQVEVDPNQLESAILNLAINARDAMPDGGKLTIETANTHLDHAYAVSNVGISPGQYAVICVSDTGTGMDDETMARAFEPFFTTKEVGRGTGLGLSQVYGFVKQSNGHVKIYSEAGEGTTVKIYLPRLMGEVPEVKSLFGHMAPEGSGSESILVVEDDDDVRAYSVEVLRDLGYRVLEAHDGPSALSLLGRQDAGVDLLFSDVVLPGGMTGAVIAEKARLLAPGLKVLFTTGYARNAIVHQGRLDPGVHLLTKPFTYEELAVRVRDILDET